MATERDRFRRYGSEFLSLSKESWLGYAFLAPVAVLMGLIVLYPIVEGITMSFQSRSMLQPDSGTWTGLQNYRELLGDSVFRTALWNSAVLTGVAVSLQYLFGLGLAILLKQKVPGITFFRSITMVTWVLPVIVIVIIFNWLVQPNYGALNIILERLGLPTTYWFADTRWALPLIIVMHVWKNVPFFAIALYAAMQAIPKDMYEAARMDGAGTLQQFRYITLPHISYVSMIMIVLHVLFTFNNFDFVYLSTGGGPLRTTEVLPTYMYKVGFETYALGYAASIGVVMMLVMLTFTAIYVKLEDFN